jgi:phosphatidylethanolamine-binding protein (PEBP) family uncharacterized protein
MNQPKTLIYTLTVSAMLALGFTSWPTLVAGETPADLDRQKSGSAFMLRSPEVTNGGTLPQDYTGDGTSSTLPLEWINAPAGTKSFALIMHHVPPDGGFKWYWVLYNIPADTHSLPKNVKGVGTLGNNSVNRRLEYAPPHSKGPGPKTYVYTVYALSAPPQITVPPSEVNREVLLAAMKDKILATAELSVVYSRPEGVASQDQGGGPGKDRPRNRPGGSGGSERPPRDATRQPGERPPPANQ